MKFALTPWMVLALLAGSLRAEDVTFASHAQIARALEQQNARIAELENALQAGNAPYEYEGHGGCDSCGDLCCDDACCDPCCRSAGIVGGAELTFLKPHSSGGVRGPSVDIDFGYDVAPRFWLGYQGSDGLGYRVRYWEFDHRKDVPATANTIEYLAYDAYTLDAEFFDSMNLGCYWDATFSAGFRYIEFQQDRRTLDANTRATLPGGDRFRNSSIGLTIGGELRRSMGCGVAGFLNSRASLLMGDETEHTIDGNGQFAFVDRELDNVYYIWEAQAGFQWTQEFGCGYLFARAACEVQVWDDVAGNNEDWGLGGVLFSTGLIR